MRGGLLEFAEVNMSAMLILKHLSVNRKCTKKVLDYGRVLR